MLIVPVKNDRITTVDSTDELVVSSYTNLKSEPSVYVTGLAESVVPFSSISTINDIKVLYNNSSKVFDSMGLLKRRINIPQPGDTIIVNSLDKNVSEPIETLTIKSIKLHDRAKKSLGLIINTDEQTYDLSQVIKIIKKNSSFEVDMKLLRKYYFDYFPISS